MINLFTNVELTNHKFKNNKCTCTSYTATNYKLNIYELKLTIYKFRILTLIAFHGSFLPFLHDFWVLLGGKNYSRDMEHVTSKNGQPNKIYKYFIMVEIVNCIGIKNPLHKTTIKMVMASNEDFLLISTFFLLLGKTAKFDMWANQDISNGYLVCVTFVVMGP